MPKGIAKDLDLYIAAAAFVVLIVVTFGGVIMRYLVGSPIIWAEEVQLWCFLWMTFFGAGAAFRYGSHVAVEIIVELLPKKVQRVVTIVDYVICVVVIAYLGYVAFGNVKLMVMIHKATNILHVPFWFINAAVIAGCLSMIVSVTLATRAQLSGKGQKSAEEQADAIGAEGGK
ncbi:MAG: TRAP transporter small permease [Succinivibrio sp.]